MRPCFAINKSRGAGGEGVVMDLPHEFYSRDPETGCGFRAKIDSGSDGVYRCWLEGWFSNKPVDASALRAVFALGFSEGLNVNQQPAPPSAEKGGDHE